METPENQYSKEYRLYMEYALERYLIQHQNYGEEDAKLKVAQDYEAVFKQAKEDKFL